MVWYPFEEMDLSTRLPLFLYCDRYTTQFTSFRLVINSFSIPKNFRNCRNRIVNALLESPLGSHTTRLSNFELRDDLYDWNMNKVETLNEYS